MGKRKRPKVGAAPQTKATPKDKASKKKKTVQTKPSRGHKEETSHPTPNDHEPTDAKIHADDPPDYKAAPTTKPSKPMENPLLDLQAKFLNDSVTPTERDNFFSEKYVSADRRAALWMEQADLGATLVNRYAWATPDHRALRILRHFAPIVEIGCGSNAYWCQLMKSMGIDVVGFDKSPTSGGKIQCNDLQASSESDQVDAFVVGSGGPEVLADHSDRTLFLCYPDEDFLETDDDDDDETHESMAQACLEHYQGDCIIHVGELFLDATFSMEQAPWGRSSSPAFQERLAAEYHCILRASLPNWLHTADRITVWKRSPTTVIAFEEEEDDDDKNVGTEMKKPSDSSESDHEGPDEVVYRHIPKEERLPVDTAAPCVAHLLTDVPIEDVPTKHVSQPDQSTSHKASPKRAKQKSSKRKSNSPPSAAQDQYKCPW